MSKTVTSNSKSYPGTVVIRDRLYLAQVELIEAALSVRPPIDNGKIVMTDVDKPRLPAVLACVESWDLQNFPKPVSQDNFPFTPRREIHELLDLLFVEIVRVYNGEKEIPNA